MTDSVALPTEEQVEIWLTYLRQIASATRGHGDGVSEAATKIGRALPALVSRLQEAERREAAAEPTGSSACPICGRDTPHAHLELLGPHDTGLMAKVDALLARYEREVVEQMQSTAVVEDAFLLETRADIRARLINCFAAESRWSSVAAQVEKLPPASIFSGEYLDRSAVLSLLRAAEGANG